MKYNTDALVGPVGVQMKDRDRARWGVVLYRKNNQYIVIVIVIVVVIDRAPLAARRGARTYYSAAEAKNNHSFHGPCSDARKLEFCETFE